MPTYKILARNKHGETEKLNLEANSETDLYAQLRQKRLKALKIQQPLPFFLSRSPQKGLKKKQLSQLFYQISLFLDAGLQLEKVLTLLARQSATASTRSILKGLIKDIRGGSSFSQALARQDPSIPDHFISTIKSGEYAGELSSTLNRLSSLLEKQQKIKSNLISSLTYPAILTLTGIACIVLIVLFAVPKFVSIFADMDKQIPVVLSILNHISQNIILYGFTLLLLIAAVVLAVLAGRNKGKSVFAAQIVKIPVVGDAIIKYNLTVFFRSLGAMLATATGIDKALAMSVNVVGNPHLKQLFQDSLTQVKKGAQFSSTLSGDKHIPDYVSSLLSVSESSGTMDKVCIKIADLIDEDLEEQLKRATQMAEPLLILSISAIIGSIVISLLYSLFSINF